ncbi:hypothetical protein PCANC_03352 [Puccinia coronata f. sp. avenae]|uniref:Uncharacterized protein n=1 Tax=Puccinia coronata f. sp. avenae TaxID=200324 RepID=A0A2N5T8P5_9BASI|nr:hypothetical protein PCANC_03352 [Puccinia coronata f. sp. avenae]
MCEGCSITKNDSGSRQNKIFNCHCGAPPVLLPQGRSQNIEAHWKSRSCKLSTSSVSNTRPITTYFPLKRPCDSQTPIQDVSTPPQTKKILVQMMCPGLNDNTWERPRATFKISQCISGSPSIYHGAPPRYKICEELFNTTKESELTEQQTEKLLQELEARSTWFIKRHTATAGIFSSKCERQVNVPPGKKALPCSQCDLLKGDNSLKKALNVEYASNNNIKYIPTILMKRDLFQSKLMLYEELRLLNESLKKHSRTGDSEFWTALAIQAKRGFFKESDTFQGLVKAVAVRTEREAAGKTLRGMQFDSYFDSFLTTMAAMSPAASKYFRDNFSGRSLRSIRIERKNNGGQIDDGIVLTNFERVAGYIKNYGYNGPLALASDQTVCVKSLRSHDGHLVGAQGGDVPFSDLEELSALVENIVAKDQLCSKVRLYTIQVPLPKIPLFVVALIASYKNETAEDIAISHISVLDYCSKAGMSIISIGSDGAAMEISALRIFQKSVDQYLCFHKKDAGIAIQVPLVGQPPQPVVAVQDPKHARKTSANQLLSGARILSFGKFQANISHLVAILGEGSPLYSHDVFNCDKQDNGRAYQTMNWETLKASLASPLYTGLSIYLYLFGELTDAWLCPSMIHLDRIRSAWTCIFFMQFWHQSINHKSNPLMSINRNGISRQSYEIFRFLGNALIGLIISHREYHPLVPLLPWKHGTEACEHIFGWMRVIMPNFTVLDARQMLPKVFAVVRNVMGGKMKIPQSDHLQSGYKYNFANEKMAESYQHLANFPSDLEITHELAVAESQARKIALFVGINPIFLTLQPAKPSTVVPNNGSVVLDNDIVVPNDDEDANEGVSVSASADYDVVYSCVPGETPLSDVMSEAASAIGNKQQVNLELEDIDIDEAHHQISSQARMSISNLLNPITPNPPALLTSFIAEQSEDKFQLVLPTLDGSDSNLNVDLMIELRKKHDTENQNGHSGNEKRKQHNFLLTGQGQSNSDQAPRPSDCRKLVAVILKNKTSKGASIARMHRWNIQVQFNLSQVRNTSTHVDVNAHLLAKGGQISETNVLSDGKFAVIVKDKKMYIGKILAIYEHVSGKHRWVASAASRAKLLNSAPSPPFSSHSGP